MIFQYKNQHLYYELHGSGPDLLFLHGNCLDSNIWNSYIPKLQNRYRLILVDLPGNGRSADIEADSISVCTQSIVALLHALQAEKPICIGHSLGAYFVLELLHSSSLSIAGIVLFHGHCFGDSPIKKAARDRVLRFIKRRGMKAYAPLFVAQLFSSKFTQEHESLVQQYTDAIANIPSDRFESMHHIMYHRASGVELLRNFNRPILVFAGTEDLIIPQKLSFDQALLGSITEVALLDCAHMGMIEQPEKSLETLNRFFNFCTLMA